MRAATLLFCLVLAACAGTSLPGQQPLPAGASADALDGLPPPAAPAPPVTPRPAPPQASRGPQSAAQRAAPPAPAAEEAEQRDPLTQARADCWMKVEHQKVRDLNARASFVDKCVSETMKSKPKS